MKNIYPIIFVLFIFASCSQNPKPEESKKDVSANTAVDSSYSQLTCPACKFVQMEKMPTEVCLLKYKCKACFKEIVPKEGDCCVFCSYGTVKCPSMQ